MFSNDLFKDYNDVTYDIRAYEYICDGNPKRLDADYIRAKFGRNMIQGEDVATVVLDALMSAVEKHNIRISDETPFAYVSYIKKIITNAQSSAYKRYKPRKRVADVKGKTYFTQEIAMPQTASETEEDSNSATLDMYEYKAYQCGLVKDEYLSVDSDLDFKFALDNIKRIEKTLIIEEGVSLIKTLVGAGKGITSSVLTLKNICSKHKDISNLVWDILSKRDALAELEAIA